MLAPGNMNGTSYFAPLGNIPTAFKHLLMAFALVLLVADLLGPGRVTNLEFLTLEIEVALGLAVLVLAGFYRGTAPHRTRLGLAATAILMSCVAAVASAEAATRWVFRRVTTSADEGGYFSRRWAGYEAMNEYGMREGSFKIVKPGGTYRIAVIGDSFTFGSGLAQHHRYSNLLDTWLPQNYEVLNFGVPGDNTPQHLDTLRQRVLPVDPDYVLLQWFINDVEGDELAGRPRALPLMPFPGVHAWLNRRSALYTVANMRWAQLQVALGLTPSYADYLKTRFGDPQSVPARRERQLLREIVATARRAGRPIAVVLFPDAGQDLGPDYPFAFLHERVLNVCREEGIPCIDLREDLARVADRPTLWVSPLDHHPSAKANEIAALRIFDRLRGEWLQAQ